MKRFLFFFILIPSLAYSAPNKVTGEFDNGDKVTINKNFQDQQREINNRVLAAPFTLNGSRGTGTDTPGLGTNAPSLLIATPYTWIDVIVGTVTCTMPVWRKN